MPEDPASAHPEERPEGRIAQDLTHFTPVPRQKDRSNGWKPEVQRAFIEALADYGSVAAACRIVGRSDNGAYQLRRHPEAGEFAAAWEAALDHGIRRLEDALMERALNGVEVPVYSYGKLVGTRVIYNDRLGMFMLRNRAPERFNAADNPRALNAVGQMRIERLKKQWLQERLALEQEQEADTLESLDAFFEDLRQRRLANEAILAEAQTAEENGGDAAAPPPPADDDTPPPDSSDPPKPRPEPRIHRF